MKPMTDQEYIEQRGMNCPECRSTFVAFGHGEIEGTNYILEGCCESCGAEWHEVYAMTGYEISQKGIPPC